MQWPGAELLRSDLFSDVQQCVVERRLAMSRHQYVGYLSTVSAYLQLSDTVQHQVYDAVARVLPETVAIVADITVHLARSRKGSRD